MRAREQNNCIPSVIFSEMTFIRCHRMMIWGGGGVTQTPRFQFTNRVRLIRLCYCASFQIGQELCWHLRRTIKCYTQFTDAHETCISPNIFANQLLAVVPHCIPENIGMYAMNWTHLLVYALFHILCKILDIFRIFAFLQSLTQFSWCTINTLHTLLLSFAVYSFSFAAKVSHLSNFHRIQDEQINRKQLC